MPRSIDCPKCQGKMGDGVIVDMGYGAVVHQSLAAGTDQSLALVGAQGTQEGRHSDRHFALHPVRISGKLRHTANLILAKMNALAVAF